MSKRSRHVQRFSAPIALAGLFALTPNLACLDDICATSQTGAYRSMGEIGKERIRTLEEGLAKSGQTLSRDQQAALTRDGQLFGVVKLSQPIKHPNGAIEMPAGWLKPLSTGHPWRRNLSPGDDAYYSFVEHRIFRAKLFDPSLPAHRQAADTYLAYVRSGKEFIGFTADDRTECEKPKTDAKSDAAGDAGTP